MEKSLEERLKEYIISKHGTVKAFSIKAGIPNSTISTIFHRGILNSTVGRVILIANALDISVDGLVEGRIEHKRGQISADDSEDIKKLKNLYVSLNKHGKERLVDEAELIAGSAKYSVSPSKSKTG